MENKELFTRTTLTEICKAAGYGRCDYNKDTTGYETLKVYDREEVNVIYTVNVSCDSLIAMVADLMKYIY